MILGSNHILILQFSCNILILQFIKSAFIFCTPTTKSCWQGHKFNLHELLDCSVTKILAHIWTAIEPKYLRIYVCYFGEKLHTLNYDVCSLKLTSFYIATIFCMNIISQKFMYCDADVMSGLLETMVEMKHI